MATFPSIPPTALPVLYAAITLGITFLVAVLGRLVVRGFLGRASPLATVTAQRLVVTIVWVTGVVVALQELGVSVGVLLLVVGLLGIAAIVAMRIPLENFGAKYFVDVYTPFKRGDTIRVGEHAGKVIELNAMSTVLLSEDDRLIALPNSVDLREPTVNLSPQAWKELIVPITLPASIDLAAFESQMMKALAKLRPRLDARYPPLFSTRARTVQGTELVLTVMVRRPEDRDPVMSEVNLRLSQGLARTEPSAPRNQGARSPPGPDLAGSKS